MNKQPYNSFYEQVKRVRDLVDNPALRNHYRKQCEGFVADLSIWAKQDESRIKEVRELRLSYGIIPKRKGDVPQSERETEAAYQEKLGKIEEKYSKIIPGPSPTEKLFLFLPDYFGGADDVANAMAIHMFFPSGKVARFSDDEILQLSYVLLTILHDMEYESDPSVTLISDGLWSFDSGFVKEVWKTVKEAGRAIGNMNVKYINKIDDALKRVEADLARREEAEREYRQDKIGFLQELTPEEPSES